MVSATPTPDNERDREHARTTRLARLTPTERDLIRIANRPGFPRWQEQIRGTGGCENPIYLTGSTTTRDTDTGELLTEYSTADEPGERLAIRCRNRRATRCAPCAHEHQGDTFHLVRSGLTGGKTVPDTVRDHPRLFVTLTAPSFGPVHRATKGGERCRPRRDRTTCPHGRPQTCASHHDDADRDIGQPLCAACYDYTHHILWNAHTRDLWDRFTRTLRRHLAHAGGITASRLGTALRLSFAKVAEYQRRGAIHFHAVVRIDGPDGPGSEPPPWASTDVLAALIPGAATAVRVSVAASAASNAIGSYALRWGTQLDVRALGASHDVTDEAVASYLAKYVTKSTEQAGAVDVRITARATIEHLPVSDHVRALLETCWNLGALPELAHLRLRPWAHMLGYRGHALTKSRVYSTTYTALRAARAEHRAPTSEAQHRTTTDATWRYAGRGHTPAEAEIAAGIAEDLAQQRALLREDQNLSGRPS